MISLEKLQANGYINCFKHNLPNFNDLTIQSLSFVLVSKESDDISMFEYTEEGIKFTEYLNPRIDGNECAKYLDVIKKYNENVIVETAKKLWLHYMGHKVTFTQEEKELLRGLGISEF
ncbi:hypothetical protein [Sulfurisphaera javensis]